MKKPSFLTTILFLFLALSLLIKVIEVRWNNFPFTMDQGRDMTDLRQMVVTRTPRLVGPTTSINGVLLGPFWYYFNLPPFIVSGGDPSAIVYWQIIWYQLACLILYAVLKKHSRSLAFFTSSLLLFAPMGFNTARYFWNANSMPIFTMLFLASLIYSASSKSKYAFIFTGLIAGLSLQIEAAFGILFFPIAFLFYLFSHQKFHKIFYSGLGFLVTLLPQILFEFRHGFIMTKIFLGEFSGKGEMLGEKIDLPERLAQRGDHLLYIIRHTNHLDQKIVIALSAISLAFLIYQFLSRKLDKSIKDISRAVLIFILFTAVFYLVFPQKLKIWYTLGFMVPAIMADAVFLFYLTKSQKIILKILPIIFIISTVFYTLSSQMDYFTVMYPMASNNPSNLQNELAAVDWVYQEASGNGFNLYSYIPSVYDYPYQHVFWWYGTKKYGYQPADIGYLPNQPEYIPKGSLAWTKKKPLSKNELTFLIIEKDKEIPAREQAWLGNFAHLCLIKNITYQWHTEVRMLSRCR